MALFKRRPHKPTRPDDNLDGNLPPKRGARNKYDDYKSSDGPGGKVVFKRPNLKPYPARPAWPPRAGGPFKRFRDSEESFAGREGAPSRRGRDGGNAPSSGFVRGPKREPGASPYPKFREDSGNSDAWPRDRDKDGYRPYKAGPKGHGERRPYDKGSSQGGDSQPYKPGPRDGG
ncbi:MAG: hypothetical protein LBU69_03795, partial [Deltaproteobacteria bacterium]|nr:hypothetical protein [Deltaproteobacteria bacterium]